MEEGRKVEEIMKKQYLEKEEQYQVEVNILKGWKKRTNFYDFKIAIIFWMIFLVVKCLLPSTLVLVFMKLLKVSLAYKLKQGNLMQNLKCSISR